MPHCININHPEVIKLANELKASKILVSADISLWQEKTHNFDRFPSKDELYPNKKEITNNNQLLNQILKDYLVKLGIQYAAVEQLHDDNGRLIEGVGLADFVNKIVRIIEAKAGLDTLPEETAHFFVRMLGKNNPLYQKMMKDIVNFNIYKEVQEMYPDYSEEDQKEEAIGRLIASLIVKKHLSTESTPNTQNFNKWWNKVWEYIKTVFRRYNSNILAKQLKADGFNEAADMILSGDISAITELNPTGKSLEHRGHASIDSVISRLASDQKNIIMDKNELDQDTDEMGVYKEYNPVKNTYRIIKGRVHKILKNITHKKWMDKVVSQKKQEIRDIYKDWGTKGHAAIDNIVNREIEYRKTNATVTEIDYNGLSPELYDLLVQKVRSLLDSYGPDVIFLPEQRVYKRKTDIAGTIDLLVLYKEKTKDSRGKVKEIVTADIYDFKFSNKNPKFEDFSATTKESWNVQLSLYSNMLKDEYGIERIKRKRIVPISPTIDRNGELIALNIDNEYVPVTGIRSKNHGKTFISDVEMTGDSKLDNLIESLVSRLDKIRTLIKKTHNVKLQHDLIDRATGLEKAIIDLQIHGSIKYMLKTIMRELQYYNNKGITNLTNDELHQFKNDTDWYHNIGINVPTNEKNIYKKELDEITAYVNDMYNDIEKESSKRITAAADKESTNIDDIQESMGLWRRLFGSVSQMNNPIIKALFRTIRTQNDKTEAKMMELYSNIERLKNAVLREAKLNGYKGNPYELLFQHNEKGERTGNTISPYTNEFYKKRDEAIENEDFKWIAENYIFPHVTTFTKQLNDYIKELNIYYESDPDKENIIKRRTRDFRETYDVYDPNYRKLAYLNIAYNHTATIQSKWVSTQWNDLHSPKNKSLLAFYDFYKKTLEEFNEFLPDYIKPTFIASIKTDVVDMFFAGGKLSWKGLKNNIQESLLASTNNVMGIADDSGNIMKTIPVHYTNEIDPNHKLYDLSKSLFMFAATAYNYKHMSEIEGLANLLKDRMYEKYKTIEGRNAYTKEVLLALSSNDEKQTFETIMDKFLYGISGNNKDVKIPINGKEYSLRKLIKGGMRWFGLNKLTFNWIISATSAVGAGVNAMSEGAAGRFYTNKEWLKASMMFATLFRNEEAKKSLNFWNIISGNNNERRANKLEYSFFSRHLTIDNALIGLRLGDESIEQVVLLSVLQSHTLNSDGKIVKAKDQEKRLINMVEVVNDKTEIKGLSFEEYNNFRDKVKYLYSTMKGNMSDEDISAIRLTLIGQMVMQFRSWIPRMADARFGELRYTQDLDLWEEGRYNTFLGNLFNSSATSFKEALGIKSAAFLSYGIYGMGANTQWTQKMLMLEAKSRYNKMVEKKPDMENKMSEEQYVDMYLSNIKATAFELQAILTVAALCVSLYGMSGVFGYDRRQRLRLFKRLFSELTFFTSPASAMTIVGNVVPLTGLLTDIGNLMGESFVAIPHPISYNYKRAWYRSLKLVPGGNEMSKWTFNLNRLTQKTH